MIDSRQAFQLAAMLYTAFADAEAGSDDVADQLLVIAQAIETNEGTPGGIDLVQFVKERGALPVGVRPALRLVT